MSSAEVEPRVVPARHRGHWAASLRKREWPIQVTILLFVVIAWEAIGRADFVYGLFPPLTDTLAGLWVILSTGAASKHVLISAQEIGVGLSAAVLGGIAMGLLMGSVDYLRRVFAPLITYVAAMPKIIIFPVLLIFFGVGLESKMAMGAISGFVPIVLNVLVGMREMDAKYIKMAHSIGASRLQLYQKIYLPGMIYPIFAGLRIGIGLAIVGTLLGELKVANGGVGWLANYYYGNYVVPKMYAILILIFIGTIGVNLIMSVVLSHLTRYKACELETEEQPLM